MESYVHSVKFITFFRIVLTFWSQSISSTDRVPRGGIFMYTIPLLFIENTWWNNWLYQCQFKCSRSLVLMVVFEFFSSIINNTKNEIEWITKNDRIFYTLLETSVEYSQLLFSSLHCLRRWLFVDALIWLLAGITNFFVSRFFDGEFRKIPNFWGSIWRKTY